MFCLCREFFYIQMEKYARQAKVENVKHSEDLVVTTESELYRVLNLHYNRNNQIEVRGITVKTRLSEPCLSEHNEKSEALALFLSPSIFCT